ncbi:MAG: 2-oxo acid dehydrogenase subunit E2, partial [Alphaproteobacteria bacterium]|nr:2-oxo acid dehydrogenase subunit E2 [Alphaproteobacteria bacterium]
AAAAPAAAPADDPQAAPTAPAPAAAPATPEPVPVPKSNGQGGRIFASPLARRMASQAGLELAGLSGTGPRGRIVKADIEAALAGGAGAPATAAAEAPAHIAQQQVVPGADSTEVRNTGMRKIIARRLQESKQSVPHFYLTVDCEIDELLKIRADLNGRSDAYKISVNDFVVRATALALRKVPEANASWTEAATIRHNRVDVSVAVAIEGGLITPIVFNADHKGLAEISAEVKELSARAREGGLKPEEYQGGTFSVSNLGMYGIKEFSAIINPPQSGILAIGAGEQRPVVRDRALAVATVMSCTLSGDHRIIDGAVGAAWLAAFKRLIEDPLTMLL